VVCGDRNLTDLHPFSRCLQPKGLARCAYLRSAYLGFSIHLDGDRHPVALTQEPPTRKYQLTSLALERAKKEANVAFEEHCAQWDLLRQIPEPTARDLEKWLSAKAAATLAQDRFEAIVRQIYD
jgi:hypothetical protein